MQRLNSRGLGGCNPQNLSWGLLRYCNPQNFIKFIRPKFDNVNYGQFVAKRPKLQLFYLSIGLLYFRLKQDGSESTCGWLLTYGIPCVADFTSPIPLPGAFHDHQIFPQWVPSMTPPRLGGVHAASSSTPTADPPWQPLTVWHRVTPMHKWHNSITLQQSVSQSVTAVSSAKAIIKSSLTCLLLTLFSSSIDYSVGFTALQFELNWNLDVFLPLWKTEQ
jgi:hypothetical protein